MRWKVAHIACWVTVLGWSAQTRVEDALACRLIPLHTGDCQLGADHVLGPDHSADERMTYAIYSFLVEGAIRTTLSMPSVGAFVHPARVVEARK